MFTIQTIQQSSNLPYKNECEDAYFFDKTTNVGVVADGITRSRNENGAYPDPSPAAAVARVIANTMGENLVEHLQGTTRIKPRHITNAFFHANQAAHQINRQLSLWVKPDYLERDRAGAVAACAVGYNGKVYYGYIGDCAVTCLSSNGDILWQTQDDVAAVQPHFPDLTGINTERNRLIVRKHFRNNPKEKHSFGALTGEDAALAYLKVRSEKYTDGEIIAVYTDGVMPFIRKDAHFRSLLCEGSGAEINSHLDKNSFSHKNCDDKTLVLMRTG